MSTKTYTPLTPEQRKARDEQRREDAAKNLERGVQQLQSEEGFANFLRARALLHHYSFNNNLLITAQLPDATRVAPTPVWRKLGRYPTKGAKALWIWARLDWHKDAGPQLPGEMNQWGQVAFNCSKHNRVCLKAHTYKPGPVFDVSQTDGDPLPEPPELVLPEGDSHAHLEPALVTLASELGYTVKTERQSGGRRGYCAPYVKRIAIADDASPNERVHILIHELAHALGIGYEEFTREEAETIVEAATYIVSAGQGFNVDAFAVPYIAGWAGSDTKKLERFAEVIDSVARRIEGAL